MDSTGNLSQPTYPSYLSLEPTAGENVDVNQAFAEAVEALNATHNDPNRAILVGSENVQDQATISSETPIFVPQEHVVITDTNRPHNPADDSDQSIAGTRQATISEVCTLGSVNWAESIVKMTSSNSSSTLTLVSHILKSLLHLYYSL